VGAATFDAAGEVVTAEGATVVISYLEPGHSGPFRVFMYGPADGADAIVDQSVYVDAEITAAEPEYGLAFSEGHHAYLDEYGEVHLVGEIINNGDEVIDTNLVAAFYDGGSNVLDAATYALPVSVKPGETLPFDLTSVWNVLGNTPKLLDKIDSYILWFDPAWTWVSTTETADLTTTNDANEFFGDSVTFTGQIVNDSGASLTRAYVIITLRDKATGELVATSYDSLYDDIPAGGTADYWVGVELKPGYDEDSLEYFFIVKGER
jgi:hypothetical protein